MLDDQGKGLSAAAAMVLASALFVAMAILVQEVGGGFVAVAARGFIPLALIAASSPFAISRAALSKERPLWFRTGLATLTISLSFYALGELPTSVVAASLKAAPVWLWLFALLSRRLQVDISLSFGIVVLLGIALLGRSAPEGYLLPIFASIGAGAIAGISYSQLAVIRMATVTEVVAHLSIGLLALGLLGLVAMGGPWNLESWGKLVGIGVVAYALQWLVAFAFRNGSGERMALLSYCSIPMAVAADIFMLDKALVPVDMLAESLLLVGTLGLLAFGPKQVLVHSKTRVRGNPEELRRYADDLARAISIAEEVTSVQFSIHITRAALTKQAIGQAYASSVLHKFRRGLLVLYSTEKGELGLAAGPGIPRFRYERVLQKATEAAADRDAAVLSIVALLSEAAKVLAADYPPETDVPDLPNDVTFA